MVKFAYIKIYIHICVTSLVLENILHLFLSTKGCILSIHCFKLYKENINVHFKTFIANRFDGTSFIEDILVCSVLEAKSGLVAVLVSGH